MVPARRVLIAAAALLVSACAPDTDTPPPADQPAAVDLGAEEQAIRARVTAWQAAANESAEAFASFYTEDGVLMAPNAPPAQGRQAIAELMAPQFGAIENITFEPLQITIASSGDLAVERGRYTLRGTLPDSTTFDDEGSYLVAWQKRNGEWQVVNDIFNTDRPAPEAAGP
jgi:uncharacterized protein (TIGR02246 family)